VKFKKQNKQNKRDKPKYQHLVVENKLMVTRGEVGRGMGEVGEGDKEYTFYIRHRIFE